MTKFEACLILLLGIACGLSAFGLSEINRISNSVAELAVEVSTVEQLTVMPSEEYLHLRTSTRHALDDLNARLVTLENDADVLSKSRPVISIEGIDAPS
jgi:hypothetical protein